MFGACLRIVNHQQLQKPFRPAFYRKPQVELYKIYLLASLAAVHLKAKSNLNLSIDQKDLRNCNFIIILFNNMPKKCVAEKDLYLLYKNY